MKFKFKKFLSLFVLSFVFVFTLGASSDVFAGVNSSSGSGGGGGGGGKWPLTDFAWKIVTNTKPGTTLTSYYGDKFKLSQGGNIAYVIPTSPPKRKAHLKDWTNWTEHPSMARNNHYGVKHYQNWDLNRNKVGAKRVMFSSKTYKEFYDELMSNGYKDCGFAPGNPKIPKKGFAYTKGGKYADVIYLGSPNKPDPDPDPEKPDPTPDPDPDKPDPKPDPEPEPEPEKPEPEPEPKPEKPKPKPPIKDPVYEVDHTSVLVKLTNDGNPSNNFDISGMSAEALWGMRGNSAKYNYKSVEDEYDFHHTLTATIYTVTRELVGSIIYDEKGNVIGDTRHYEYYISGSRTVQNTATWEAEIPSLKYEFYLPMKLNNDGFMTRDELFKYGVGYYNIKEIPLKGRTKNYKKTRDDKPLQLVDNNSSKKFTMELHNDQIGIPTKSEGGVDITPSKPGKPGLGDPILWEQLYYDPKLYMSSNKTEYNPSLTSLVSEGKEYVGTETITKGYGYKGGDFEYKSIKIGNYNLGYKNNPFWMCHYGTTIYFDYGGSYDGVVTSAGKWYPTDEEGCIYVKEDRRFVSEVNGTIKQPILYGDFEVKTVGGYKKED